LAAGVTVATIHQRLRDEHGLDASVASLRRWVRANLPESGRRARVTVLGDASPPGEQAQIDYGRLGMWLDPTWGRRRAVWAFVMVLQCSRHLFVRPTLTMDQAEWTAAHVEAFARSTTFATSSLTTSSASSRTSSSTPQARQADRIKARASPREPSTGSSSRRRLARSEPAPCTSDGYPRGHSIPRFAPDTAPDSIRHHELPVKVGPPPGPWGQRAVAASLRRQLAAD
jgi:hypothetical protein